MSSQIQLFDAKNIDEISWPHTEDAQYAQKFFVPFVKNGISNYIQNIDAKPYLLKVNDHIFPLIVSSENYSNSWVCSPYAHYISYGKQYLSIIDHPVLARLMKNFIHGIEKLSRWTKMNSVVYVNNWMFSTDLYPEGLEQAEVKAVYDFLTQHFPQHAIIMRSLNAITTPDLMKSLSKEGFHLIASRYVFISDANKDSLFKTRILKSDLKLWKETPYQILDEQDLDAEDCKKLLDLHWNLYVVQHSQLQPQYTYDYFKMLLERGLLKFKVLKSQGHIKGVAGYYKRGKVMMCPIFGYEKNQPESNGIYRLLNTALLLEAQKKGLLFNQSAGAAFFKSVRRAEGSLEYMAVFTKHLPAYRKFFWTTLKFFINKIGSKYMQKY